MKLMNVFRSLSLPTAALLSATMLFTSCGQTAESIGSIGSGGQVGELSYDSKERQILGQARGVGALVGAAAGFAIAKNNKKSQLGGALLGGVLGAAAGDAIGRGQANKARNKRLDNNTMRKLIAAARADNARLAAYKRKVARRLAAVRAAKASDRARMARAERKSVDRAIATTDRRIKTLKSTRSQFAGHQQAQYTTEIRKAQADRNVLASQSREFAGYERVAAR